MDRSKRRSGVLELGQILATAVVSTVIALIVIGLGPGMEKNYEAHDIQIPRATALMLNFSWLGLLIPTAFAVCVPLLKKREAAPGLILVVSIGFMLLSVTWLILAFWLYSLPLHQPHV